MNTPWEAIDARHVRWNHQTYLYFAGCDYLRMSYHALTEPHKPLDQGAFPFLSVGASRSTTGEQSIYLELEQSLSDYTLSEAARLTGAGYLASLSLADHLREKASAIFLDQYAHPALQDTARLAQCPIHVYEHRSPTSALELLSRTEGSSNVFLLSDGVFGLDGSIMPVERFHQLLPPEITFLIDDAHGFGCHGPSCRGVSALCPPHQRQILTTASLSKALGCHGGVVLGDEKILDSVSRQGHIWRAHTPLPPSIAYSAWRNLLWLKDHPDHLASLEKRTASFNAIWTASQRSFLEFPIVALSTPSQKALEEAKQYLTEAGIYPPHIHYPHGAPHGLFRFSWSTAHTLADVNLLANTLSGLVSNGLADHFKLSCDPVS